MKFKATAAQIGDQDARDSARRALNKAAGSTSKWKHPSPNHCVVYGCESLATHDLVLRHFYRTGDEKRIGMCADHAYKNKKLFHYYKDGCYVDRRA